MVEQAEPDGRQKKRRNSLVLESKLFFGDDVKWGDGAKAGGRSRGCARCARAGEGGGVFVRALDASGGRIGGPI